MMRHKPVPPRPPTVVRFSDLAHHLEEQVRGRTDPATVNRYRQAMQSGETFPPLGVAEVAGALILFDGFHRRDALEALGIEEALAEIIPCRGLKEARWLGFKANLRHGQPLKPKHHRPALNAFLAAGLNRREGGGLMSYRELAMELPGVSYGTIRRWIEKDHPALFAKMGGAEGAAPGGCADLPSPMTPAEENLAAGRSHIAEAEALLRGLPVEMRRRAAIDVRGLLGALTWDDPDAGAGQEPWF